MSTSSTPAAEPPKRKKTTEEKKESKSWKGIISICILLIIGFVTYVFWPTSDQKDSASALKAEIEQLRKELGDKNLPPPLELDKQEQERPTIPPVAPAVPEGRRVSLGNVTHQPTGPVIKSLHPNVMKGSNGEKVRLLMGGPGGSKVLMYPSDRPLLEVDQHLVFDGFKPPAGDLVVVDTQPDPATGRMMNIYGWRLK